MRIAYADCYSGISGDMFLAALVDAGLPLETLRDGIDRLDLPEKVELRLTEARRGPMRAASLEVTAADSQAERGLGDMLAILDRSRLSDGVKATATRIFTLLAEAEGHVHGEPPEQVHFHEVGAVDSIVDVVGAAVGLEALGIARLHASALPYGAGTVESRHGRLPLPAPATLELLRMATAPMVPAKANVELVTPTGAAILAALGTFGAPDITIQRVGVGAGKRELPWPNVLRLFVGETAGDIGAAPEGPGSGDRGSENRGSEEREPAVLIETNIDDMNPQLYGYVMQRLFDAGARDVYLTPIQMKKNRPGTLLAVVARRQDETVLAELILRETTTLGVRVQPVRRYLAGREFRPVRTRFGAVTVKQKVIDGVVAGYTPEYEDCVRLAGENGVGLAEIYQATNEELLR
jgi:uncharacterized protein (TIGR00299 family) protein